MEDHVTFINTIKNNAMLISIVTIGVCLAGITLALFFNPGELIHIYRIKMSGFSVSSNVADEITNMDLNSIRNYIATTCKEANIGKKYYDDETLLIKVDCFLEKRFLENATVYFRNDENLNDASYTDEFMRELLTHFNEQIQNNIRYMESLAERNVALIDKTDKYISIIDEYISKIYPGAVNKELGQSISMAVDSVISLNEYKGERNAQLKEQRSIIEDLNNFVPFTYKKEKVINGKMQMIIVYIIASLIIGLCSSIVIAYYKESSRQATNKDSK